jgi:hypothetical protein
MAIPFMACMLAVATALHLPPRVLPSIQAIEGGRVGMSRANSNGTEDLGLMQVNSTWLPVLARRTGLPPETVRKRMVQDGCFNIAIAGAVLRFYLHETHGDLLAAIGNYHSHKPIRHRAYQLKVIGAALAMFGRASVPRTADPNHR